MKPNHNQESKTCPRDCIYIMSEYIFLKRNCLYWRGECYKKQAINNLSP